MQNGQRAAVFPAARRIFLQSTPAPFRTPQGMIEKPAHAEYNRDKIISFVCGFSKNITLPILKNSV
jgi:hypothetical protein